MQINAKTTMLFFCGLVWLIGCGGQASLKPVVVQDGKATVADIAQNFEDYHVFFISIHGNTGNTALLFDPRDDGRKLVANNWTPVEDDHALSGYLQMMESRGYTGLFEILGSDNHFFGYLMAARAHIAARQIDDNTMEIYGFRQQNTGP